MVGRRAAAAHRLVGGRHGHRGARDQGAAAERAQLRGAGLPDARRHARPGRREPVRRQHLQPARRVELQRARPSGQRQRLADRRHRQQRVHVQHRDHRAVGRAGARVQGAVGRVLRRVRPRRRRRVGGDQVGQQRAPRHGVRVPARRRVRRAQLLRAEGGAAGRRAAGRSEAAARPPSVRRRGRRRGGDSRPLRRPQPDVLLRRLRGAEGDARPGLRQHRADGADAQRRLQQLPRHQRQPDPHLRPAHDAAEPGVQFEPAGERHQPAVPARPVPRQHHPAEPDQPRRPQRRQHLPAAERARATSTTTRPPSTARSPTTCSPAASTTGSSDKDSFFVRFNWGKFKLDAPQGQAACCLPTPAEAAARFDLGPFVAGIQNTRLTTHGAGVQLFARHVDRSFVNELRAGYAQDAAVHVPVRLRHQRGRLARHPRHQRHRVHDRPARTSTSRTSPASPAARRSCR